MLVGLSPTALIPASKGALNYRRRIQELSEVSASHRSPSPPTPIPVGALGSQEGEREGPGVQQAPLRQVTLLPGPGLITPPSLFYFTLKDNCFTMLCWFLQYNSMNQP